MENADRHSSQDILTQLSLGMKVLISLACNITGSLERGYFAQK
jgi:hypothetical protein